MLAPFEQCDLEIFTYEEKYSFLVSFTKATFHSFVQVAKYQWSKQNIIVLVNDELHNGVILFACSKEYL